MNLDTIVYQAAHVVFKSLAVISYFLLNTFVNSSVVTFGIVILIGAIDFWVVKNITGRKLVALRWWTDIDNNGEQTWIFQSVQKQLSQSNINIFWGGQLAFLFFWAIFSLFNIFSPFWLTLDLSCAGLLAINLVGYYKCRGQHQKKLKQTAINYGLQMVSDNI